MTGVLVAAPVTSSTTTTDPVVADTVHVQDVSPAEATFQYVQFVKSADPALSGPDRATQPVGTLVIAIVPLFAADSTAMSTFPAAVAEANVPTRDVLPELSAWDWDWTRETAMG
jgi:hypothetical protein